MEYAISSHYVSTYEILTLQDKGAKFRNLVFQRIVALSLGSKDIYLPVAKPQHLQGEFVAGAIDLFDQKGYEIQVPHL